MRIKGLPWEDNGFFQGNNAELDQHVATYSEARHGIVKTNADRAKEAAIKKREEEEAFNRPMFEVPQDMMESDWTGTKYVTTHRCFGQPCKDEEEEKKAALASRSYIQLDQPTGAFERERDN